MKVITGNFVMEGEEKYLRNTTLDERRAALKEMRKQQNVNCRILEVDYLEQMPGTVKGTYRPLTVLALMYLERSHTGEGYWQFAARYGVTFTLNDKADRLAREQSKR